MLTIQLIRSAHTHTKVNHRLQAVVASFPFRPARCALQEDFEELLAFATAPPWNRCAANAGRNAQVDHGRCC